MATFLFRLSVPTSRKPMLARLSNDLNRYRKQYRMAGSTLLPTHHPHEQGFTPPLFLAHLEVEYLGLAHGTKDGVRPVNATVLGQPWHTARPDLG
jgi:hypothetical protein